MTATTPTPHRRTRIHTIVWGAILVGIAVLALMVLAGGSFGPMAVLWSLIGFGALLVLAAVVTAIVRAALGTGTKAGTGAGTEYPPIG